MGNPTELPPVGHAIKERRRLLGLTQERLAERTGLKRAYIGDIELKERNVSLKTLAKISDALEMKISQLVALAEEALENNVHKTVAGNGDGNQF